MDTGLDDNDEEFMDNRLGRLAGLAAFSLMLLRLGRLIESGGDTPAWQLIMIASAFLGGVIWWLLSQTMSSRKIAVAIFLAAGGVLFLRIAVPHTLVAGFFPTLETYSVLIREMTQAVDVIRFGSAPIYPTSGVLAILSALMWATGGLYVWGATDGPATAMVIPSVGLYLQFAVMDSVPAGRGWMGAAAVVFALSTAAVAMERRSDAGRVRDLEGRPLPRRAGGLAFVMAMVVAVGAILMANTSSALVPENGNIQWRVGSGYGPGSGGITFNRLADLQQSIISRTNAVLFMARLDEDAPNADQIYWRMESLDLFDGETWRPDSQVEFYSPSVVGGDRDYAYQGSTQSVVQSLRSENLKQEILPIAGIASYLESDSINTSAFQIKADGSVVYQSLLKPGNQYQAVSTISLHNQDLGALASVTPDQLSPLFAAAVADGQVDLEPGPIPGDMTRPDGIERFLDLPDDIPAGVRTIGTIRTTGATTDFEKAWLLEAWFRSSGDFKYSTNVSTGHGSLDLENWLTDPTTQNYRTGYCEQFASTMAVLGRQLGIPSRVVWGFTPGDVVVEGDEEIIQVRDSNAHAWVEMWMDGFGWVRFDPTPRGDGAIPESATAAFDPVAYLPAPDELNLEDNPFEEIGEGANPFGLDDADLGIADDQGLEIQWWWFLVLALILSAVAVPLIKSFRRRRRMKRLRDGDITAAWEEIIDRLEDLGTPVPAYQTPIEFANATDRSLVPIARTYSAAVYGGVNGKASPEDMETVESWLKLRYEGGKRTWAAFNFKSLFR